MSQHDALIAQMQAHVITKAATDAAFRAELLANPRAVIEREFKSELPAHIQISVQEAPANTVVVTLPHTTVVGAGGELSDDDLETVAGGSKSGATTFFTGVGSAVGVVAGAPVSMATTAVKACF